MDKDCWIKLNKLLNSSKSDHLQIEKFNSILYAAEIINKETPFCLIENFETTYEKLKNMPLWISYGGRRTGSTFIFNFLRIIMNSLTTRFLYAWEGDYSSPIKFYESILNNNLLIGGILKIHRYEEEIPRLLNNDKAIAIISIRDYPNKIKSWWRMVNNKRSPFYKKNYNKDNIIRFIEKEIERKLKKEN